MKVLLINNCFFRRGGSEAVYFGTADLLRKHGHEVVFFSMADENNIKSEGSVYYVPKGGKLSQILAYFNNNKAARLLRDVLQKEKPDIAHVHLFWGGISPSIFSVLKEYGIPLVHTVHDYRMVCPAYTFRNGKGELCEKCKGGHFMECFKGRCSKGSAIQSALMAAEMYYRNIKWHPAKELDGIIYVSQFAKGKHEELDERFVRTKNTVLYNFTSVGESYPPVNMDGGYYLYYGRLSHEKGIATLVDAFAKRKDLILKVVGTGPKEEELKKKECANIDFLGYKTGSELYNLVRKARFVCVPSEWYENNPMTIVEAYSMGVPVIGARIGGIPEIVEDMETGLLFESGNLNDLGEKIDSAESLSSKAYKMMREQAYIFYVNHFSEENYYKRLINFYNEVLA